MTFSKKTKKFTVAVITPVFPYPKRGILPGIERYIENLVFSLVKSGIEVKILTTYSNGGKRYDYYKGIQILRILDSRAILGRIGNIFYLNHITFGLNILIKRNFKFIQNCNVILFPLAIGFTGFFKLNKYPVISTFHHYDSPKSLIEYLTLPVYHFLEKRQLRKSKNIIAVSDFAKKEAIRFYGINENKIKVIPNGVDTDKFDPSNFSKEIKSEYGDNILLFVGPFVKRKRIPVLLEAMTKVMKVIPDVHLILIGDGLLLGDHIKLSDSLGLQKNASFLGFVETELLLKCYASSDIFIFPSELEGFGQVLLEAMASGTPCICANKDPMAKILGDAGETFKVNDSEDLSVKIIELLKDREKLANLRERSFEIIEKYNLKAISKQFRKYFEGIVNNKEG